MKLIISSASGKPIYEQITSQLKALIITGELKEGDLLPSMRVLARELRISVITTKRAYEELEREGFITTVTGKGSYVARADTDFIREEHLRRIEEHLRAAKTLSDACGIGADGLKEMLDILYEER